MQSSTINVFENHRWMKALVKEPATRLEMGMRLGLGKEVPCGPVQYAQDRGYVKPYEVRTPEEGRSIYQITPEGMARLRRVPARAGRPAAQLFPSFTPSLLARAPPHRPARNADFQGFPPASPAHEVLGFGSPVPCISSSPAPTPHAPVAALPPATPAPASGADAGGSNSDTEARIKRGLTYAKYLLDEIIAGSAARCALEDAMGQVSPAAPTETAIEAVLAAAEAALPEVEEAIQAELMALIRKPLGPVLDGLRIRRAASQLAAAKAADADAAAKGQDLQGAVAAAEAAFEEARAALETARAAAGAHQAVREATQAALAEAEAEYEEVTGGEEMVPPSPRSREAATPRQARPREEVGPEDPAPPAKRPRRSRPSKATRLAWVAKAQQALADGQPKTLEEIFPEEAAAWDPAAGRFSSRSSPYSVLANPSRKHIFKVKGRPGKWSLVAPA